MCFLFQIIIKHQNFITMTIKDELTHNEIISLLENEALSSEFRDTLYQDQEVKYPFTLTVPESDAAIIKNKVESEQRAFKDAKETLEHTYMESVESHNIAVESFRNVVKVAYPNFVDDGDMEAQEIQVSLFS